MLDMPSARKTSTSTSIRRPTRSSIGRDGAGWQGLLLVALGWSGVALAYGAVALAHDPSSRSAVVWTVGLSVVSLLAIAGGARIAYAAARSPLRHVFRSRPLSFTATALLTIAVIPVALLISRSPFDGMAAHGKPLSQLMCDLNVIAASAISGGGGLAALREAWSARRDERTWDGG